MVLCTVALPTLVPPTAKLLEQCNKVMNTTFSEASIMEVDIDDIGMTQHIALHALLCAVKKILLSNHTHVPINAHMHICTPNTGMAPSLQLRGVLALLLNTTFKLRSLSVLHM